MLASMLPLQQALPQNYNNIHLTCPVHLTELSLPLREKKKEKTGKASCSARQTRLVGISAPTASRLLAPCFSLLLWFRSHSVLFTCTLPDFLKYLNKTLHKTNRKIHHKQSPNAGALTNGQATGNQKMLAGDL